MVKDAFAFEKHGEDEPSRHPCQQILVETSSKYRRCLMSFIFDSGDTMLKGSNRFGELKVGELHSLSLTASMSPGAKVKFERLFFPLF